MTTVRRSVAFVPILLVGIGVILLVRVGLAGPIVIEGGFSHSAKGAPGFAGVGTVEILESTLIAMGVGLMLLGAIGCVALARTRAR